MFSKKSPNQVMHRLLISAFAPWCVRHGGSDLIARPGAGHGHGLLVLYVPNGATLRSR
jgi:hypothetical protein